jgi:hypothetical protein
MAIPVTDSMRQELNLFLERLLSACKKDGITQEKAHADLLAIIEAAARDDWDEIDERLTKAELEAWDD